jgi:hypothetical protein
MLNILMPILSSHHNFYATVGQGKSFCLDEWVAWASMFIIIIRHKTMQEDANDK